MHAYAEPSHHSLTRDGIDGLSPHLMRSLHGTADPCWPVPLQFCPVYVAVIVHSSQRVCCWRCRS